MEPCIKSCKGNMACEFHRAHNMHRDTNTNWNLWKRMRWIYWQVIVFGCISSPISMKLWTSFIINPPSSLEEMLGSKKNICHKLHCALMCREIPLCQIMAICRLMFVCCRQPFAELVSLFQRLHWLHNFTLEIRVCICNSNYPLIGQKINKSNNSPPRDSGQYFAHKECNSLVSEQRQIDVMPSVTHSFDLGVETVHLMVFIGPMTTSAHLPFFSFLTSCGTCCVLALWKQGSSKCVFHTYNLYPLLWLFY